MRATKAVAIILLASMIFITGCMTHIHVIGEGSKSGAVEQERQWYVLWGLVPINKIDTKVMAKGGKDYEIKTEMNALDVIINIFTSAITVYTRTVEVKR
jgi:hypothetical protein